MKKIFISFLAFGLWGINLIYCMEPKIDKPMKAAKIYNKENLIRSMYLRKTNFVFLPFLLKLHNFTHFITHECGHILISKLFVGGNVTLHVGSSAFTGRPPIFETNNIKLYNLFKVTEGGISYKNFERMMALAKWKRIFIIGAGGIVGAICDCLWLRGLAAYRNHQKSGDTTTNMNNNSPVLQMHDFFEKILMFRGIKNIFMAFSPTYVGDHRIFSLPEKYLGNFSDGAKIWDLFQVSCQKRFIAAFVACIVPRALVAFFVVDAGRKYYKRCFKSKHGACDV